jgi:hypothetical protein
VSVVCKPQSVLPPPPGTGIAVEVRADAAINDHRGRVRPTVRRMGYLLRRTTTRTVPPTMVLLPCPRHWVVTIGLVLHVECVGRSQELAMLVEPALPQRSCSKVPTFAHPAMLYAATTRPILILRHQDLIFPVPVSPTPAHKWNPTRLEGLEAVGFG